MNTIYLDMDGVLADFEKTAKQIIKPVDGELHKDSQSYWPRDQWEQLLAYPHLYRQLDKMPQADVMVQIARRFRDDLGWNLRALTAIPRRNDIPFVFEDKIDWMRKHYADIPVFFGPYSEDKHRFCQPGDILVDDRLSNIEQWRAASGLAVLVEEDRYSYAIEQLLDLFKRQCELMAQEQIYPIILT